MFAGLPGGPHPAMTVSACVGWGELSCSVLSASISSTGLHFACPFVYPSLTQARGVYVEGSRAIGLLVPAGVPCHRGDMRHGPSAFSHPCPH